MNNVTSITKAARLTEKEVHEAAQNLIDNDEVLSSLSLLKALGRGSLTTITKYLGTFHKENNQSESFSTPGFTELPDSLSRTTKLLAIKIWTEAQAIANKDLESQRDALQHAAKLSADRIKEAEEFSDEQAKRLEELERIYVEDNEELKQTVSVLNLELENKKDEFNQIVTKYEVLKNEQLLLTENFKKIEKQISDTKTENDSHTTELKKAHQTSLDELEKALTTLTSDKEHHAKKIEEVEKENKFLREKASMLEGELKAWKTFKPKSD